jgi:cellulose synthase/poly-beta-1,6-N-acetylglucosamine synthase-like glycosyltransferase
MAVTRSRLPGALTCLVVSWISFSRARFSSQTSAVEASWNRLKYQTNLLLCSTYVRIYIYIYIYIHTNTLYLSIYIFICTLMHSVCIYIYTLSIYIYIWEQKSLFSSSPNAQAGWKSHHVIICLVPGKRIQPRSWGSSAMLEGTKGPIFRCGYLVSKNWTK